MNTFKKLTLLSVISGSLLLSGDTFAQQLKVPAPSPSQTIEQDFALSKIKIAYSRPSVKGREIFGGLVEYDKVWRSGANAATEITFGQDVTVEGNAVPAGTYALYTIPGKSSWTVMLYKDLSLGGNVAEYDKAKELVRFNVTPQTLTSPVETFTININDIRPNTATLELVWATTRVPVKISADIDATIMKNIESALSVDRRPYYQAASYYYENDKDLAQALVWVDEAIKQQPYAFWVKHLKAKILLKQKEYKKAIEAAEASMAQAREANNNDYVKLNEKLIAEAGKK